ncbi:MAG: helix-turn-helix domain-containing protein [Mitsuaria chitosanitabida]|uniref:response regulator transcription factor n=1 Tax=Roseateles chitosanitabidus TaxID=65048 RepID=UPI001B27C664|nr:LuxR C-terminal-related transcriptional regulator [Roseateles chitosanitabidus]MBO9688119.1 helix-turn-helix domain-containing protein [Roseateles chitosanitabidus]
MPHRLRLLTTRERDVLRLVARGQSSPAIASALGLSPHTVRVHRAHLLQKLQVRNSAQLAVLAYALGLNAPERSPPIDPACVDGLTPREAQVIQALAQGRTSKEIAQALGVSDQTVRKHRENLMRKFQVHSTAALIRRWWAIEPPGDPLGI